MSVSISSTVGKPQPGGLWNDDTGEKEIERRGRNKAWPRNEEAESKWDKGCAVADGALCKWQGGSGRDGSRIETRKKTDQRVEEGLFLHEIHGGWRLVLGSWFLVLVLGDARCVGLVGPQWSRPLPAGRFCVSHDAVCGLSWLPFLPFVVKGPGGCCYRTRRGWGEERRRCSLENKKRRGETSETRNDSAAAGRGEDGGRGGGQERRLPHR